MIEAEATCQTKDVRMEETSKFAALSGCAYSDMKSVLLALSLSLLFVPLRQ